MPSEMEINFEFWKNYLKDVSRLNVLGLWSFDQDPLRRLAYGQRLQGSGQLSFGNKGLCLYLGIGQLGSIVEHHQDAHLVGVNAKDVFLGLTLVNWGCRCGRY